MQDQQQEKALEQAQSRKNAEQRDEIRSTNEKMKNMQIKLEHHEQEAAEQALRATTSALRRQEGSYQKEAESYKARVRAELREAEANKNEEAQQR
eukprot:987753-Pyramimonas_sp.AAC.1